MPEVDFFNFKIFFANFTPLLSIWKNNPYFRWVENNNKKKSLRVQESLDGSLQKKVNWSTGCQYYKITQFFFQPSVVSGQST